MHIHTYIYIYTYIHIYIYTQTYICAYIWLICIFVLQKLTQHCNAIIFHCNIYTGQFSSVIQSCPHATPWTAAPPASLSITNSRSLPKLMSIESVMLSNHLILYHPLLLLPSIFPNIRVFSNESVLCIRWPKYCSFSFNISPSNEHQD